MPRLPAGSFEESVVKCARITVVVLSGMLCAASAASACTCLGLPPEAIIARSTYAFDGTVIEGSLGHDPHGQIAWVMRVRVDRLIKGALASEAMVYSIGDPNACGVQYQRGFAARFTVNGSPAELWASACGMLGLDGRGRRS
jgi:hypothetical protein